MKHPIVTPTHPQTIFFVSRMTTGSAPVVEASEKWKSWGIPVSEFIEDVGKYLTENHKIGDKEVGTDSAEVALRKLDELLHKYKMFEAGLSEKVRQITK